MLGQFMTGTTSGSYFPGNILL